jgi:hypothetical protein
VLDEPGKRNQAASVLLPPAQAQRVMLIGGGPSDMHDMTGATNTTAITDLSVPNPRVAMAAPMAMRRMHLCATLLPDRSVLVNGGAMMEESAADAMLDAEIYHPDIGGGPGTWAMAAASRVARLYHSVALLMPDGKVITAGSNPARKTEELRIEVFWPPYLFSGPRPTCAPAATDVAYGGPLAATVPDAAQIASACLMRPGGHHAFARRRAAARGPAHPGDRPGRGTAADACGRNYRPPGLVPAVHGSTRPACPPWAAGST